MRSIISSSCASVTVLMLFFGALGLDGTSRAEAAETDATAASENLYTKSYVSKNSPTVALQPDATGPKIYQGSEKDKDYKRMLENGFDMLGYSSFDATEDVNPDQLTEQAKKVKADLVLVYTKLTGNTPASVRIQQLREKALKATKNPDANSGSAANDLTDEHALYSYFASYWVKLAPPLIGVHVTGSGEAETGLKVLAVVKDSPAAKVALQEGDVLTRIGEMELTKPEVLTQAAQRYAGQTVEITWRRDGDTNKAAITLNKRP